MYCTINILQFPIFQSTKGIFVGNEGMFVKDVRHQSHHPCLRFYGAPKRALKDGQRNIRITDELEGPHSLY